MSLAGELLHRLGVTDRCELVGSDFFERVPPRGNLDLLKHIIHTWDDDRARAILRNCHRAIDESARHLIIYRVLSARTGPDDDIGYLIDMTMLALTPGVDWVDCHMWVLEGGR